MENLTDTLRISEKLGAGHFKIYIEIDYAFYYCNTNNMAAFDAAFDQDWNEGDDYHEAREALVNEILRKNDLI